MTAAQERCFEMDVSHFNSLSKPHGKSIDSAGAVPVLQTYSRQRVSMDVNPCTLVLATCADTVVSSHSLAERVQLVDMFGHVRNCVHGRTLLSLKPKSACASRSHMFKTDESQICNCQMWTTQKLCRSRGVMKGTPKHPCLKR